jgi:hypothetical protein
MANFIQMKTGGFADIPNNDLLKRHRLIASDLARKWSRTENVLGIVGLGGLATGTVDEFSDIDLALFVQSIRKNRIRTGESSYDGFDVEVLVFEYEHEFGSTWSDVQQEAFSKHILLFDRHGRIAGLIAAKTKYNKSRARRRIIDIIFQLAWLGIADARYQGKLRRGYHWSLPPDLMLRRGDAVAAAANLNYCLDLIVQLLFAVNCSPVPDVKWRFHRVTNLPWLPKQFQATYPAFIINASLDSNELRRRIDIITDWVHSAARRPLRRRLGAE